MTPGECILGTLDPKERKGIPLATGVIDYFPDALLAVAELSRIGNDQHNPGQPLHWARGKGGNNADELARHFVQRGTLDSDNVRHSTKVAWRALAILQLEIEAAYQEQQDFYAKGGIREGVPMYVTNTPREPNDPRWRVK